MWRGNGEPRVLTGCQVVPAQGRSCLSHHHDAELHMEVPPHSDLSPRPEHKGYLYVKGSNGRYLRSILRLSILVASTIVLGHGWVAPLVLAPMGVLHRNMQVKSYSSLKPPPNFSRRGLSASIGLVPPLDSEGQVVLSRNNLPSIGLEDLNRVKGFKVGPRTLAQSVLNGGRPDTVTGSQVQVSSFSGVSRGIDTTMGRADNPITRIMLMWKVQIPHDRVQALKLDPKVVKLWAGNLVFSPLKATSKGAPNGTQVCCLTQALRPTPYRSNILLCSMRSKGIQPVGWYKSLKVSIL